MERISNMGHALKRVVLLGVMEMPAYIGATILFAMATKPERSDIITFVLLVCLFCFNTM
jgi:hypothetical protein